MANKAIAKTDRGTTRDPAFWRGESIGAPESPEALSRPPIEAQQCILEMIRWAECAKYLLDLGAFSIDQLLELRKAMQLQSETEERDGK